VNQCAGCAVEDTMVQSDDALAQAKRARTSS
jgi:hypothetical protein